MAKNIQVLLNDHLQAIGVKTLLHDCFGAQVSILDPIDQIEPDANADLYVTQSTALVANMNFFLPRKEKVVLIEHGKHDGNWATTIDNTQSVDQLIASFDQIINAQHNENSSSLSQREIDVLKLVAEGRINKEIANELNISINTVLTHRKNISAKLGIKSVSGLCVYALMNGIIEA